jgi:hypothetical protein
MLSLAHPDAAIAIRTLIALIFLSAATAKMRHWTILQGVVANYRLLPQVLVVPVTCALPPAEAAIAVALPTGLFAPWAEAAAALLLGAFALAMGINLLRGRRHIDCGCFQGALKQPLRWALVIRNALLVLLLGVAVAVPPGRPGGWIVVNGLLAGSALFLVLQSLNTLWAIIPAVRRPSQPRVQMEGTS